MSVSIKKKKSRRKREARRGTRLHPKTCLLCFIVIKTVNLPRVVLTHLTLSPRDCCRWLLSRWCGPPLCRPPGRSPGCRRQGYWRWGARRSSTCGTGSRAIWCCDRLGPAAAGSWWRWRRPGRCESPRRRRTSYAVGTQETETGS